MHTILQFKIIYIGSTSGEEEPDKPLAKEVIIILI